MPDCASATVYVWPLPEGRFRGRKRLHEALKGIGVNPETYEFAGFDGNATVETLEDGSRRLMVESYDSPWGINADDVRALIRAARAAGLAYVAEDGGHYTWDAYAVWWHPGMEGEAEIRSSVDGGNYAINVFDLQRIAEERFPQDDAGLGAHLRRLIAESDPLEWRP